MKTTKSYAPPTLEAITLNAEVGFAASPKFTVTNDDYDITDEIRWE